MLANDHWTHSSSPRIIIGKISEKCSHHNNTALINRISLFDTALVMTNIQSFNSNIKILERYETREKLDNVSSDHNV